MEDFRAVKPYTKRKVKEPLNDKFTRIQDIIEAEEAAHKTPKRRRVALRADPAPLVEEAQEMIVHGLDRLREAEEM